MKKWNILSDYDGSVGLIKLLLANRGISSKQEVEAFLNPPEIKELSRLLPSELKHSLTEAKRIISKAINSNVPIVVHGDYDADGICATAILYNTLKNELKYDQTYYFIPNRFEHGYGLSKSSIDEAIKKVSQDRKKEPKEILFVTVDSGITAKDEVAYIKSLGHKIIVTDHHQQPQSLPKADCIVWYDKIVGATLAWLLARVMGSEDSKTISLVALATVTDLQTVLGVNRSLVKKGLQILNTNPPVGLQKLLQVAGKKGVEVTTYDLGWVIGPRLNASGRLVDAADSLLLLIERNERRAEELAIKLNQVNIERQDKTLEMYKVASGFSETNLPKIIFSLNEEYHEGIIGLVAAKLAQKYYRPSVVISLSDEHGKGSVRSIPGVDIIAFLRKFEELFESLGGHPMAAGFTIKREYIEELQNQMLMAANEFIDDSLLQPVLNVDLKIPLTLVNMSLIDEIEKLKPFGLGNEEPTFMSENIGVVDVNLLGRENQHLGLKLYDNGNFYKAIIFNGGENAKSVGFGSRLDLVYNLRKNEYNGNKYIDIVVKDFRVCE